MLPFTCEKPDFKTGDFVYLADIAECVEKGERRVVAKVISSGGKTRDTVLCLPEFTADERAILLAGCLINYNKGKKA